MTQTLFVAARALRWPGAPNARARAPTLAWRSVAFAAFGAAAVGVSAWGQPMREPGLWIVLGAFVCAATEGVACVGAARDCESRALWPCLLALVCGLAFDFARVPATALLDLCRVPDGGGLLAASLREHWRYFPATLLAMALPIVATTVRRGIGAAPQLRALLIAGGALELLAMSLAMPLGMSATRAFALRCALPWEAGSIACAMLLGMLLFFALRRALRALTARAGIA